MGIFTMWFHLLTVAAFVALGSTRRHYSLRQANPAANASCTEEKCSCFCPTTSCPPCPLPYPVDCLTGCGSPECPCINPLVGPNEKKRSSSPGASRWDANRAYAISTVNSHSTGPLCSAFHILPNVVVTLSTCVAGRDVADLFVTVNDKNPDKYRTQPRKVLQVVTDPTSLSVIGPVALALKVPSDPQKLEVDCLDLPVKPSQDDFPTEIQKWQVLNNGEDYFPLRIKVNKHVPCKEKVGDSLCASIDSPAAMGWNDIGTPIVELHDSGPQVQGIYAGYNLYENSDTVKYLSLYQYATWLTEVIDIYN